MKNLNELKNKYQQINENNKEELEQELMEIDIITDDITKMVVILDNPVIYIKGCSFETLENIASFLVENKGFKVTGEKQNQIVVSGFQNNQKEYKYFTR